MSRVINKTITGTWLPWTLVWSWLDAAAGSPVSHRCSRVCSLLALSIAHAHAAKYQSRCPTQRTRFLSLSSAFTAPVCVTVTSPLFLHNSFPLLLFPPAPFLFLSVLCPCDCLCYSFTHVFPHVADVMAAKETAGSPISYLPFFSVLHACRVPFAYVSPWRVRLSMFLLF